MNYSHPHPNPAHVLFLYRRHILASKRIFGRARALVHYQALLKEYLAAKRAVLTDFDEVKYLEAKTLAYPHKKKT